jgi:hypothetical protein
MKMNLAAIIIIIFIIILFLSCNTTKEATKNEYQKDYEVVASYDITYDGHFDLITYHGYERSYDISGETTIMIQKYKDGTFIAAPNPRFSCDYSDFYIEMSILSKLRKEEYKNSYLIKVCDGNCSHLSYIDDYEELVLKLGKYGKMDLLPEYIGFKEDLKTPPHTIMSTSYLNINYIK